MVIMGLDLSTHSGLVCLSSKNKDFCFSTELNTNLLGFERLAWFRGVILEHIVTYTPDLVVLEGYAYGGKFINSFQYEIGSIIRMALHDAKIDWLEIPPTILKKTLTGKGVAKKELIMLEVYKRWGFTAKTNNVADAYVLAKLGVLISGSDVGLPKTYTDCLWSVDSVAKQVKILSTKV